MKKLVSIALALCLMSLSVCAFGEYARYDETVVLTTARAMDSTALFDESDPEKTSFEQNRWNATILEKLNVDIDYKWIATDNDSNTTKWNAAMASGDLPDFALVSDQTYQLLMNMGAVADCTQIYEDCISDRYKALLNDNAVSQMTFGGKLYGIPKPNMGYSPTLFYARQDWLDELGLSFPQSLDEIVEVAQAFQDAEMGGEGTLGLLVGLNGRANLSGLINVFGAQYDYWVERDGLVAYSNIQPEMREALLEMQKLYADGIINPDFAVASLDVICEYIAGGKAGLFYADCTLPCTTLQPLLTSNPNAEFTWTTIKGVNGEDIQFQTATPSVGKIFVNAKCANLEAVAQVINLYEDLCNSTDPVIYESYSWGHDGFPWQKYNPIGDRPTVINNDIACGNEIRLALESGAQKAEDYPFTLADAKGWFAPTLEGKNGVREQLWWYYTLGEKGTFTVSYDAYVAGLHLDNAYVGLPTATQQKVGSVINENLHTAMFEVIMGADISVYDDACETWLISGGEAITDEINEALGR